MSEKHCEVYDHLLDYKMSAEDEKDDALVEIINDLLDEVWRQMDSADQAQFPPAEC